MMTSFLFLATPEVETRLRQNQMTSQFSCVFLRFKVAKTPLLRSYSNWQSLREIKILEREILKREKLKKRAKMDNK